MNVNNAKTIEISSSANTTTWCLQPDGNWRNEDAHSWALNYGNSDDEDIRSSEELQREVDFSLSCGRHVEMW